MSTPLPWNPLRSSTTTESLPASPLTVKAACDVDDPGDAERRTLTDLDPVVARATADAGRDTRRQHVDLIHAIERFDSQLLDRGVSDYVGRGRAQRHLGGRNAERIGRAGAPDGQPIDTGPAVRQRAGQGRDDQSVITAGALYRIVAGPTVEGVGPAAARKHIVPAVAEQQHTGGHRGVRIDAVVSVVAVDRRRGAWIRAAHRERVVARAEVHVERLERAVGQATRTHAQTGQGRGGQRSGVRRRVSAVIHRQRVGSRLAVDRQRSGDPIDARRCPGAGHHGVVAGPRVDCGRGRRVRAGNTERVGPRPQVHLQQRDPAVAHPRPHPESRDRRGSERPGVGRGVTAVIHNQGVLAVADNRDRTREIVHGPAQVGRGTAELDEVVAHRGTDGRLSPCLRAPDQYACVTTGRGIDIETLDRCIVDRGGAAQPDENRRRRERHVGVVAPAAIVYRQGVVARFAIDRQRRADVRSRTAERGRKAPDRDDIVAAARAHRRGGRRIRGLHVEAVRTGAELHAQGFDRTVREPARAEAESRQSRCGEDTGVSRRVAAVVDGQRVGTRAAVDRLRPADRVGREHHVVEAAGIESERVLPANAQVGHVAQRLEQLCFRCDRSASTAHAPVRCEQVDGVTREACPRPGPQRRNQREPATAQDHVVGKCELVGGRRLPQVKRQCSAVLGGLVAAELRWRHPIPHRAQALVGRLNKAARVAAAGDTSQIGAVVGRGPAVQAGRSVLESTFRGRCAADGERIRQRSADHVLE